MAVGKQNPLCDVHLMLRRERKDVRECDVLEMDVGIYGHGWFRQKVRLAIQLESATIKDHRVDMYIGGILVGLRFAHFECCPRGNSAG